MAEISRSLLCMAMMVLTTWRRVFVMNLSMLRVDTSFTVYKTWLQYGSPKVMLGSLRPSNTSVIEAWDLLKSTGDGRPEMVQHYMKKSVGVRCTVVAM